MDTLVVDTPQQYEARAIELAGDPRALAELRRGLLASAATAALFDPRRFARRLEQAYLRMHDRHRAGLPPDHLVIADASASD
jgi:predicted O-linked N-acetylglucosamine transferase (SPINDLY family)